MVFNERHILVSLGLVEIVAGSHKPELLALFSGALVELEPAMEIRSAFWWWLT